MMNRRRAFGLISHITPVVLPVFLVVFYAPFIAAPLHAQGWTKGAALAAGFAIPLGWLLLSTGMLFIVPERFVKLKAALGIAVLGVPMLGVFALVLWDLLRFLIHIAR
jgi:hypothetical protein